LRIFLLFLIPSIPGAEPQGNEVILFKISDSFTIRTGWSFSGGFGNDWNLVEDPCLLRSVRKVSSSKGAILSSELKILTAPFMSKSLTFASILLPREFENLYFQIDVGKLKEENKIHIIFNF
jgi:hypothetical protein